MKYNIQKIKGDWVDYNDVKLLIRPVPFSVFNTDELMDNDHLWMLFDYALRDWKDILNEKNEELKCNQKNKKMIFEFDHPLREFVYGQSQEGIIEKVKTAKK